MSLYADLLKKVLVVGQHTLLSKERLDNLEHCVLSVLEDGVQGDLLEAGVWKGGACILMAGLLAEANDSERKVLVCDSFEGLPKPERPEDAGDKHYLREDLKISVDIVSKNFQWHDLLSDQIVFIKGFFKDSLPAVDNQLAILRCDGDMYGSTMDTLSNLYPQLSPGGYCIIDDYSFPNVELACKTYREDNGINEEIYRIDEYGAFWRKT